MADCLWDSQVLVLSSEAVLDLPGDILKILTLGTNAEYLISLSKLALDPDWTELIFSSYRPLFLDCVGRWIIEPQADITSSLRILTALSKVLPFCPQLVPYIQEITSQNRHGIFCSRGQPNPTIKLLDIPSDSLCQILVLLLRLLAFDQHGFSSLVTPIQMQELCSHVELHIRYLACRVLGLLFHFTDKAIMNHIERYCGTAVLCGDLDGKQIDFRFHDIWEEQRIQRLQQLIKAKKEPRSKSVSKRTINESDLCVRVTNFAGYLAIIPGPVSPELGTIVATPTAQRNLKKVAESICCNHATLVVGAAGSGKTTLIDEVAKRFHQSSRILTLYLNAQTDAKLLIGLYTSVVETGAFKWQPGVLTKAVLEGRWVLIEDLDRAPSEVMSVLLPLLDTGQLTVPNLGGSIHAAPGFKLIGTVRSHTDSQGTEMPLSNILGIRHWNRVSLEQYLPYDFQQIVSTSFPLLRLLSDHIMNMYNAISQHAQLNQTIRSGSKLPSLQELLRFCSRVSCLLKENGMSTESDAFPDSVNTQIFLEAIDIFCVGISSENAKLQMVDVIAQELHISAETVRFCVELRIPAREQKVNSVRYGRAELSLRSFTNKNSASRQKVRRPFAQTNHSLKILESVASAVKFKTPCLLVGETGTGKTTIVQELADAIGQKLFVVNLSQQSEVGDLLGGFKPVTLRALATPIKDEFDLLFDITLKSNKNEKFLTALTRNFKKGEWLRVLKLWQEASKTAIAALEKQAAKDENPSKKRKIDASETRRLSTRWQQLISNMEIFKKHCESGSKGFAFSYMEGNLVKAVRHGHWILLDEINLAPHDTLESLADLLSADSHKVPSILLGDSGEIQRVTAHLDFRVFAAMNPATDVGKRDLPPGIRSRFAEYYVSSCEDDSDSLIQICSAYLGDYTLSDRRIAHDVTSLYQSIRTLEKDNRLVDGAGQKPHFTLRSLSRTLTYATDIAKIYGLRRSLYEGFCMSFLTLLDGASTALVTPLIYQHLLASYKNARSILHQIPKCPGENLKYVQFRHYWMVKGPFPVIEQPHYIITPFVEANLLNLVRATSSKRYPILLQGPTSSGKTSMIEYLAKISGNKFVRINNHEHTDLQEYLGTYVSGPNGLLFQDGVLVKALREGHWLVLDELNLAPTDILEALNRLLDDNRELLIPETQEIVRPHPDFMLFATQNPPGLYGGRKVLSRAFRNRFLELHFDDIPENELETILRERSQIAPSFCTKIVEVYKRLAVLRQTHRLFEQKNSFATLRDLFRWAFRDADNIEQLAINGFMLLCERVRDLGERDSVKSIIEEIMRVKIDETKLYTVDDSQKEYIKQSGDLAGRVTMTKAMSRLYILVSAALRNNEPVLLIGHTGCGKTTVCQMIAESMETELHILNAHQNTETGDIIGAQRPIRNRQQTISDLQALLQNVLRPNFGTILDPTSPLEGLLERYCELSSTEKCLIPPDQQHEIDHLVTKSKALFEWADGILVTAMRAGHHFLLDEISLADDSVLERLNSVLEPSRSLLLAEKGGVDTMITAHNNFQFLATMNPGGDYGKKELSPALRNRFTEIWVPELSDEEDTLNIIASKLTKTLQKLAQPIVSFARWFDRCCGENQAAPSLRQMLSLAEFLNLRHEMDSDLSVSIVHGAAMVYIDGIGTDPAAKLYLTHNDISKKRSVCLDQLSNLFDISAHDIYHKKHEILPQKGALCVGPFTVVSNNDATQTTSFDLKAPTTIQNALRLVRGLQIPKPILVEGSPGVGKTSLIETIARILGVSLTRINLSEQTDLMDLFGSDVPVENGSVGQFEWRDAPFLTAMQKGEWVLLDEMNLASQSVLEGLNACLDHRGQIYIPELDRSFSKHSKFTLFAAQNPHAQGGGRKGLPASFVNRFTLVYADSFTMEDMIQISASMFPNIDTSIISALASYIFSLNLFIDNSFTALSAGGLWEFNLRDLLRWLTLISKENSVLSAAVPGDFEDMLVLGRFRGSKDAESVKTGIHSPFTESSRTRTRYQNLGNSFIQCGFGLLQKSLTGCETVRIPEGKNLNVLESVMIAVEQNWPCLLVGPSGSGKSRLLRGLASTYGADIITLALNNAMDTMDIIGGYEQVDYSRHLKSLLLDIAQEIQHLWAQSDSEAFIAMLASAWLALDAYDQNPQLLMDKLNDLSSANCTSIAILITRLTELVQRMQGRQQAQFEWIDGALVKAIEHGSWLILDNANLCNASVLDRLNALLEADGILSLNEHRLKDGSSRIVTRNPNFRLFLTMDSRHGELSRAMRNRCVEIYTPAMDESANSPLVDHVQSVSQSKLNAFLKFDWEKIPGPQSSPLLDVILSHLSITQHLNFDALLDQVSKGLYVMQPQLDLLLRHAQQTFALAFGRPSVANLLRQMHTEFLEFSCFDEKYLTTAVLEQPIDLTVNTALLSMHAKKGTLDALFSFSELIEARLKLGRMQQEMIRIQMSLPHKLKQDLTRLERSLLTTSDRRFSNDSTAPVAGMLNDLVVDLESQLDVRILPEISEIQAATKTIEFCQDLLVFTHNSVIDEGKLFAYVRLGWMLLQQQELSNKAYSSYQTFRHKLMLFGNVSVNQDMEALWHYLKPKTFKSLEQLSQISRLQDIARRFDIAAWKSPIAIKSIVELQASFSLISFKREDESLWRLQEIEELVRQQENDKSSESVAIKPHFRDTFAMLKQYSQMGSPGIAQYGLRELDVLSGEHLLLIRNDGISNTNQPILLDLASLFGSIEHHAYLGAVRGDFSADLVRKLQDLTSTPLRRLLRLQEELPLLCKHISGKTSQITDSPIRKICSILTRLVLDILNAHQHLLESTSFANWSTHLHALLDDEVTSAQSFQPPTITAINNLASHQASALQKLLLKSLQALTEVNKTSRVDHNDWKTVGEAWVQFSFICLRLYLPDHPFDPALGPRLDYERWQRRKYELENQLAALDLYENMIHGQPVEFRRRLLHKKLDNLGEEPETLFIARPERSQIVDLHIELLNIQRTILIRLESEERIALLDDSRRLDELRRHVQASIRRLNTSYEGYHDITKPATGFLQALDIGLSVLSLSKNSEAMFLAHSHDVRSATNLFGLNLKQIPHDMPHCSLTSSMSALDHRYVYLIYLRLCKDVQGTSSDSIAVATADLFRQFYEEWKTKLSEEQNQEAIRSSLYRFQDKEESSDSDDAAALTALFPTFDKEENERSTSSTQSSPAMLAQKLADIQAQIFSETKGCQVTLAEFLVDIQERVIGASAPSQKHFFPFSNADTLSGVLLALDKTQRYITNLDSQTTTPDFYNGPNLLAAEKLLVLVRNVRSRFRSIHETWPEHAIPGLILQTVEETLDCNHSEPLAKFITLAEKLHSFVHEWQSIASREFSVAALYDELTQLIISWRRIELSSWSQLLDREENKHSQEAKSWWFIAYEAILYPLTNVNISVEEGKGFAVQLSSELQNFIKTTNLGQFTTRLSILGSCERQAAAMSQRFPAFVPVAETLSNTVEFFTRWQSRVQDEIKQQRALLDTKMKDIILLASWKDTNIEALRASSRRSHNALFKIVKKYRETLAAPAEPLLVPNSGHQAQSEYTTTCISMLKLEGDIGKASSICSSYWPELSQSSRWLANSQSTASLMARVGKIPELDFRPVLWLNSFTTNLRGAIKSLQQETPSKLTAENKTVVKHLKVRKRNLLADTLKELRQMGIRSNLNADALQNQNTTSKILATIAHRRQLSEAREDFYAILDNASQIRNLSGKPTNDLSPQEVARCVGFLDGVLFQLINQHHSICSSLEEVRYCDSILTRLHELWQPGKYYVLPATADDVTIGAISKRLQWLIAILQLAVQLIGILMNMGEEDFTTVKAELLSREEALVSLLATINGCPDLSSVHLKTSKQADLLENFKRELHQLSSFIVATIQRLPNLRFILIHVLPWLDLENSTEIPLSLPSENLQNPTIDEVSSPIQDVNFTDVDNIVKQLLVGLQQYKTALEALPHSNDDAAWLIKHDEALRNAGMSMHVTSIMANIQSILLPNAYSTDQTLAKACAAGGLVLPLLQQYRNTSAEVLNYRIDGYVALCQLANTLSTSLKQILTQGFCTPKEDSQLEQDASQTEGVGLGDGEGAEDISKDVQGDEDLTELAQNAQNKQEDSSNDHDIDNEDNAIDLGEEDLEGKLDSEGEERQNGEDDSGDEKEENVSEEVGDVDTLDPSAVDEKLWEEEANKEQKEREGKTEGKQAKNDGSALENNENNVDALSDAEYNSEDLDEHTLDAEDQNTIDPHINEGDNLELPEDMQMENTKPLESDEDIMDELSESSEEETGENDTHTNPDQDEMRADDAENDNKEDGVDDSKEEISPEFQASEVEAEEEPNTTGEEITRSQLDQLSISNDPDISQLNDHLGTGTDTLQNEHEEDEMQGDHRNAGLNASDTQAKDSSAMKTATQNGELAQNEPENESGRSDDDPKGDQQTAPAADPFRKLGEALEKWRRSQYIHEASQQQEQESSEQHDDFQHLSTENDKSDAQVLGPAAEDEIHALSKDELDMEVDASVPEPDSAVNEVDTSAENPEFAESDQSASDPIEKVDTFIGSREPEDKEHKLDNDMLDYHQEANTEESIGDIDADLLESKLQATSDPGKSIDEARRLWQQCENATRDLSLILTEQLRLILAPSLATKMRGDFRTGKRLSIKRIIPYIASGYKRDKIWMRRSVPSKRSYQVMLAVDDSKSMTESGGSKLAFESLALLSRSLTMLEVGQICIASFGEYFQIAHNFDQQFSTEAAINVFHHFTFNQTKTNVHNLMTRSLEVFREARVKQASSNADLWQLQLIISDGVCEDHEAIRQLVRQAREERIMIVFAVINSAGNHSILNMTQASFEPDENGETKLRIKRYLEGFPFPYYLIVGDVKNLPGVLSTALRQWFAEVVDS